MPQPVTGHAPYTVVPGRLWEESPQVLRPWVLTTYATICRDAPRSGRYCTPLDLLSRSSGVPIPRLRIALKWLVSQGWLVAEPCPGVATAYHIQHMVKVEAA